MSRVILVHWNQPEARERIARLKRLGFEAGWFGGTGHDGQMQRTRANPPDAFVIDLSRLPSHGREIATALRQQKATRGVPLVFVDGDPPKVSRIREMLPDAMYTDWSKLREALFQALRNPPAEPVVWRSLSGPNSGVPLARKLGLKPGTTLTLLDAPRGFETQLGPAIEGLTIRRRASGAAETVMLFARMRAGFERRLPVAIKTLAPRGGLWVAWPKRASGVVSDLAQQDVREACLARGLVDHKVCAVDEVWSGLRFARQSDQRRRTG